MPKMSTELARQALNGSTMGTRRSAIFYAEPGFEAAPVNAALQAAVDEVDAQMSTWRPDSDLMRLSAAPEGAWVALPAWLIEVLAFSLEVARASGGAFDIGMGDAVAAWGFGADPADPGRIRAALGAPRRPVYEVLEIEPGARRSRRHGPASFDLCGIAKGYGVDRLAETLEAFGITDALVSIDGDLRALGMRPDGNPWPVAIERPDPDRRAPLSVLALKRMPPWRPPATTVIGSRSEGGASPTRWTRSGAAYSWSLPPRSQWWPEPAWPPMPGQPPSWYWVARRGGGSHEGSGWMCSSWIVRGTPFGSRL
jgi:thiamine biosynthesis lipoprotein